MEVSEIEAKGKSVAAPGKDGNRGERRRRRRCTVNEGEREEYKGWYSGGGGPAEGGSSQEARIEAESGVKA